MGWQTAAKMCSIRSQMSEGALLWGAAEVRCSGGLLGWQYSRKDAQTRRETVWVRQGSEGWRCEHLITFSLRKSQLSAPLVACTCLVLCCLSLIFQVFFLLLSYTLHYPSPLLFLPHPLPEALSSELPRFFIKEISLEPSNYYGKRKKQREEKALREMSSFYSFSMSLPQSHKCVHIFCIPPF